MSISILIMLYLANKIQKVMKMKLMNVNNKNNMKEDKINFI